MTQPPTTPGYQSHLPPQGASGLATAAMVVGIVAVCLSLVLFCFPVIGGLIGVVALILGAVAISQGGPASAGRARAGLIMGIIAVVVSIGWYMLWRAGVSFLQKKAPQWQQQMQQKADEMQRQAEEAQKKAEDAAKKANQQKPTTEPGTLGPAPFPWRLASRFGNLPDQTLYLVMPTNA
jgi:thiol:disulfide interchange protein